MNEQVDVVVVGRGPGGEYLAGTLAEAGLDVVGVEAELVGGECPYWGCVPSKMMIRAGNALAEARRVPALAGRAEVAPDWGPVAGRIRHEATDDWNDRVAADRLAAKGGRLVRGRGRLTGPHRVTVDGRVFEARRGVVLATGSRPRIPPVPGLAATPYWTNRDAMAAKELPAPMLVLGGGAIGAEVAQVVAVHLPGHHRGGTGPTAGPGGTGGGRTRRRGPAHRRSDRPDRGAGSPSRP
ncbi:FAD-dependent oxidoreductase [Streptomyces sp. NPDC001508]|uniref:FAD-dependent oxidoreductase n=1 Tax=Streptomyces sp. NPDC001508 TaxID=3154656 RepID=UPI00331C247F